MSLAGAKVGDEVVLTDKNERGARRARVESVGRKYATIEGRKYEIDTGVVADAHRHARAYPVEMWEREQAKESFVAAVQRLDELRRMDLGRLTTEQIREEALALDEVRCKIAALVGYDAGGA